MVGHESRRMLRWWIVAALLAAAVAVQLIVGYKILMDPQETYVRVPSPDGRYVAITVHVFDPREGVFDAAWIAEAGSERSEWRQVVGWREGRVEARWESERKLIFETRPAIPGTITWRGVTVEVRDEPVCNRAPFDGR